MEFTFKILNSHFKQKDLALQIIAELYPPPLSISIDSDNLGYTKITLHFSSEKDRQDFLEILRQNKIHFGELN